MRITQRIPKLSMIFIFAALFLVACSTSESPVPPDEAPIEIPEAAPLDRSLPPIMGVALDPSGNAIPLATVGDETGDSNGVISGDLEVSPTGWLSVEAIGYSTGYTHTFGQSGGNSMFEARLTPFSAGSYLDGETSETIIIQNDEQLSIELTIDSSLLAEPDALVMMAVIDRLDIDASYQGVDDREDLNLHFAFAVQAFDDGWEEIPLATGASIMANFVLPRELKGDLILATFNTSSGLWESIPAACTPTDSHSYSCNLDRLSPLFGLFHDSEIIRKQTDLPVTDGIASTNIGGALMSISPSRGSLEGSEWDSKFKLAWDKIAEWLKSKEASFYFDDPENTEGYPDDPELLDLIDDLIDAAMEFANLNRNEAGKTHLIKASEPAHLIGHDEIAAPALNEAGHIALEMGEEILKDPECGKIKEAYRVAENNSKLAVETKSTSNQQMAQDIYEAYEPLLEKCDIWQGTISVRLPTMNTHPVDDFSRTSGSSEWLEIHQVQISTNVETKASRAENHVRLLFHSVNYTALGFECPNEITYSSSQLGRTLLAAQGYFDGEIFTFDNFQVGMGGGTSSITQWWNFQSKDDDADVCVPDPGGQQTIRLPYYSVLAHGFIDETPSITLQEMLDSWEVGSDVIQGSREIANPEPDTGNIPVATGEVLWNLVHEVKLLPIELKR